MSSSRRAHCGWAAGVALAVLGARLVVPAAASVPPPSPVAFSVSVSQHTLIYGGPAVTLAIEMRTGPSPRTVGIQRTGPSWPERAVSGSPLALTNERVQGQGTIESHSVHGGVPQQPGEPVCARGEGDAQGYGVDLALPAHSTTTLSYDVRLAAPPWPHTSYDPRLLANIPASNATVRGISFYPLVTPRLASGRPSGVHIMMSAYPHRHRDPFGAVLVPRGGAVTISGHTDPIRSRPSCRVNSRGVAPLEGDVMRRSPPRRPRWCPGRVRHAAGGGGVRSRRRFWGSCSRPASRGRRAPARPR